MLKIKNKKNPIKFTKDGFDYTISTFNKKLIVKKSISGSKSTSQEYFYSESCTWENNKLNIKLFDTKKEILELF